MVLNRHPVLRDFYYTEDLRDGPRKHKLLQQTNMGSFNNAGYRVIALERKIDNLIHLNRAQETLICNLQAKCNFLENCLKKTKPVSFKEDSDNNVALLRTFFDLKPAAVKEDVEPLEEMKGLLKEFSDNKADSVALVRQVRGG
jgi:hypothetical protein